MANEELQSEEVAPEPMPPEQNRVTINLDEEGDDGGEEKGAAAPGTDKKSRREQGRDFRRQRETYERDLAQLRTELAELRGRVSVPAPAPGGGQGAGGADPLDTEIQSLDEQQNALMRAIQVPGQTDTEVKGLVDSWKKIERHKRRLEYRQFRAAEKLDEPGPEQGNRQFVASTLEAEYPEIWASESMRLRARAEMVELVGRGKPEGLATAREACQRVAERFGIGRRVPGPTDLERSRHSGIPARAGVAGNGSGNQYTPSKFEMSLATSFTKHRPNLTDEERWRVWAEATGNKRRSTG